MPPPWVEPLVKTLKKLERGPNLTLKKLEHMYTKLYTKKHNWELFTKVPDPSPKVAGRTSLQRIEKSFLLRIVLSAFTAIIARVSWPHMSRQMLGMPRIVVTIFENPLHQNCPTNTLVSAMPAVNGDVAKLYRRGIPFEFFKV